MQHTPMSFNCVFCEKVCKNKNSQTQHQIRCKLNLESQDLRERMCFHEGHNRPSKHKGLTYEEIYAERSQEIRDKVKEGIKNSPNIRKLEGDKKVEWIAKIKETCRKNRKSGGLREGSGRGIKTWYSSPCAGQIYLRSSYELSFAIWLDQNKVNWLQPNHSFPYFDSHGNQRKYYPDFYLVEQDAYIEIKGYKTELDDLKWEGIPNLLVLFRDDLISMGVIKN